MPPPFRISTTHQLYCTDSSSTGIAYLHHFWSLLVDRECESSNNGDKAFLGHDGWRFWFYQKQVVIALAMLKGKAATGLVPIPVHGVEYGLGLTTSHYRIYNGTDLSLSLPRSIPRVKHSRISTGSLVCRPSLHEPNSDLSIEARPV